MVTLGIIRNGKEENKKKKQRRKKSQRKAIKIEGVTASKREF